MSIFDKTKRIVVFYEKYKKYLKIWYQFVPDFSLLNGELLLYKNEFVTMNQFTLTNNDKTISLLKTNIVRFFVRFKVEIRVDN